MFAKKSDGCLCKVLSVFWVFAQVCEVDIRMFPSAERDDSFELGIRLFVILFEIEDDGKKVLVM